MSINKTQGFVNDCRGANPLVAVIILIAGFTIFFTLYALFSEPLSEVWEATENAVTSPRTPDVWTPLRQVWVIIAVLAVILVSLWFWAYLHRSEREAEVYMR